MNDETRPQTQVLVDLLRSTNGGAVSVELMRAVVWRPFYNPEPIDWRGAIDALVRTTRHRLGVRIDQVKSWPFVGYRISD